MLGYAGGVDSGVAFSESEESSDRNEEEFTVVCLLLDYIVTWTVPCTSCRFTHYNESGNSDAC